MSKPMFKRLKSGDVKVTVPSDYDFDAIEQVVLLMAMDALNADPEPRPTKPNRGQTGKPAPSREERQRLHEERRRAALMRTTTSQRQFDLACDNEGLERSRWIDEGQRPARERKAQYRPYVGG